VVDSAGVVLPTAGHLVRFTVEGPARLLAVGNGNPADHGPSQARERRAFHGLLLAMVQSGPETGRVRVTARADGLPPATVDIRVMAGNPPPALR
jgi:beta-galactosidase